MTDQNLHPNPTPFVGMLKQGMVHIIHHNDMDGCCSAAITVFAFLLMELQLRPELEQQQHQSVTLPIKLYEVDYSRPANISAMRPGDKVIIVDFSYPPEEMAKIEQAIHYIPGTTDIIWIDHHATAKRYNHQYAGLRNFDNKGPAACELTWLYFFPEQAMPPAVKLIGDYDSWRLADPKSFVFHEGAKMILDTPKNDIWPLLFIGDNAKLSFIENAGEVAIIYRDIYTKKLRTSYGYETTLGGHHAYALNVFGFGSPAFGEVFDQYPMVISYIHDGQKFTVSLYSRDIDVSVIARRFGGGGHKGAAGFVCDYLPFKPLEITGGKKDEPAK